MGWSDCNVVFVLNVVANLFTFFAEAEHHQAMPAADEVVKQKLAQAREARAAVDAKRTDAQAKLAAIEELLAQAREKLAASTVGSPEWLAWSEQIAANTDAFTASSKLLVAYIEESVLHSRTIQRCVERLAAIESRRGTALETPGAAAAAGPKHSGPDAMRFESVSMHHVCKPFAVVVRRNPLQ